MDVICYDFYSLNNDVDGFLTGPVFEKPVYHIRLTEGYMPPRGLLASVKAYDNDTGINAMLTYELIPDDAPILRLSEDVERTGFTSRRIISRREVSTEDLDLEMVNEDATSNQRAGDVSRFFMVKPNDGSIVLKQMVDYEKAHEFRFSVVVKDSGIPPLSSTARVVVQGKSRKSTLHNNNVQFDKIY